MRVVFRTDSSAQIGTGHLMRCLTLANMLARGGADVSFVCRDLPGNCSSLVGEHDFPLVLLSRPDAGSVVQEYTNEYGRWLGVPLEEDARQIVEYLDEHDRYDWLIVDHYSLDERWESALRPYVGRIMVIDDIADRSHDCDLLLDQNLYDNSESRYSALVSDNCRLLLGPRYALLRDEFYEVRDSARLRTGEVRKLLVFFGGADITNETSKTLRAIQGLTTTDISVEVVVGSANRFRIEIENLSKTMPNVRLHGQINNMASLMATADLSIGGGGTTTWERCFLGLPTMTIILAENQREMTEAAAKRGALWNLGWSDSVSEVDIQTTFRRLCVSPDERSRVSENAFAIMDALCTSNGHSVITELFEEALC